MGILLVLKNNVPISEGTFFIIIGSLWRISSSAIRRAVRCLLATVMGNTRSLFKWGYYG